MFDARKADATAVCARADGGPEGCTPDAEGTTCELTAFLAEDVVESCIMTLAVGIVEEETGDPTVCTLVPGTDGTGGSCTVSGGGATPGTCAYQPAASATGTYVSVLHESH